MWLRSLRADRLRNLRAVRVDLGAGITILKGRNGAGKTSLLEAAYLLGTGHSFRTRRLDEIVSRTGGPLRVSGDVANRTGITPLSVVLDGGARRLTADGRDVDLGSFLGRLDLVAMPNDAPRMLRDGPVERRRFLDAGVVGLDPGFLSVLGEYRKVLAERNALLRSSAGRGFARRTEHEAWEDRLAAAAARVHVARRDYADRLGALLPEAGRALLPAGRELRLSFAPSPSGTAAQPPGAFKLLYRTALEKGRHRDQTLGFTAIGPHRDDFRVTLDGIDIRTQGSSGQVRAAVVALCAGKLGLLKERRGESPLFLMDDFDSDLDEVGTTALLEYLHDGRFQAILATARGRFSPSSEVPHGAVTVEAGETRSS